MELKKNVKKKNRIVIIYKISNLENLILKKISILKKKYLAYDPSKNVSQSGPAVCSAIADIYKYI